jgi:hypothetical protein
VPTIFRRWWARFRLRSSSYDGNFAHPHMGICVSRPVIGLDWVY